MKRTECDLKQSPGRPFLRKVCTGLIAGAMIALAAVPAMASDYEIRFDFPNRTINSGTVNVYKVLEFEELGDNKANITYAKGFENLFKTQEELEDFTAFLTDKGDTFSSEEYQNYMNLVREKIKAGASGVTVDLAADAKKADVDGLGLYFVGNPDSNSFSLNLTETANNRRGDVSVSGFFVSLTGDDLDTATGTYARTSMPKSGIDPLPSPGGGTPPGGGGGNPPSSGRRVTPPSEGSVLGASRDAAQPMPEVLGANRLPQTGQLWWPVPVLCILGLGLISSGVYRRRAALAVH